MSHLRLRLSIAVAVLVSLVAADAAFASVVVSEFRTRGPEGGNDEFVELRNTGTTAVAIGGWRLEGCASGTPGNASLRVAVPAGVSLPAGGSYLFANTTAPGYSAAVAPDATYGTGFTDFGTTNFAGIRIVDTTGTVRDGVGSPLSPCREGTGFTTPGTNGDNSFERIGGAQDTNNNVDDFAGPKAGNPQSLAADAAPAVASTAPGNGATGVPRTTNLTVTFNEQVSVDGGAFELQCASSGSHTLAVSGGPTAFTLTPAAQLAADEQCTVTVLADRVHDVDALDPPDTMAANYVFSFRTVAATAACGDPVTSIGVLQGSGDVSPFAGEARSIEGVVVGDHEGAAPALRGFYVQDAGDGDTATSDGIFVFNGGNQDLVATGDRVRVSGTVGENQGQTQISTTAANILVCGTGSVSTTDVTLPVASATFLERYEGMLVRMAQTLYVTEHFQLGRFGQVVLSSGDRLTQPTSVVAPGAAAIAMQEQNNLNRLILDDSSQFQNPDPIVWGRNGMALSAANTLRGGDTVTGAVGVMTYTWAGNAASGNAYRLRPINALGGSATFVAANPRPTETPDVGGRVQVAGMNVLNFFNTFSGCTSGVAGGPTDCRGANSATEFNRQWPKTVEAIVATGADVVGLGEIENDGYGPTSAIQFLVDQLNAATAPGTWALIDADARSGQIDALGTDAIKVGLIYKPGVVTPVGTTGVLNSVEFVNGGDPAPRNRATLAQAFVDNVSGAIFVVTPNHLKSKGSACVAPDAGDGQGNCAAVRTNAANVLADWLLNQNPTGTGSRNILIVGDLNSYAKEDPIAALEAAGFTNLISAHLGPDAYSYVFDGQWGYLDHALGSQAILSAVTGVAEFHINADEPAVLDYNVEFKSAGQVASLYAPDMYRMSDHDPVVVGLQLDTTFASLCELVRLYSSKPGIADALCAKLDAAAASAGRDNEKSKAGQLGAFVNQVEAQRDKALTSVEAETLIRLAGTL